MFNEWWLLFFIPIDKVFHSSMIFIMGWFLFHFLHIISPFYPDISSIFPFLALHAHYLSTITPFILSIPLLPLPAFTLPPSSHYCNHRWPPGPYRSNTAGKHFRQILTQYSLPRLARLRLGSSCSLNCGEFFCSPSVCLWIGHIHFHSPPFDLLAFIGSMMYVMRKFDYFGR